MQLEPERADQGKGANLYEPVFLLENYSANDGRIQLTLVSNEDDIRVTRYPKIIIDYVQLQDEVHSNLIAHISRISYFNVGWAALFFVISAVLTFSPNSQNGIQLGFLALGSIGAVCLLIQEKYSFWRYCKKRISTHFIEQAYLRFGQVANEADS
ncbi:MAG: hypothetical protein ACSHX5_00495 [Phycisphaerales bacterium]